MYDSSLIVSGLNHTFHSMQQKGSDYLVYEGDEIVWYDGKGNVIDRFPDRADMSTHR